VTFHSSRALSLRLKWKSRDWNCIFRHGPINGGTCAPSIIKIIEMANAFSHKLVVGERRFMTLAQLLIRLHVVNVNCRNDLPWSTQYY